ncbi:MAG TPA: GspH/FimT family pseudopilin [Acidobacteriota bacterium]|nr:GspH/FimT family pseudopilin [Acidobacteriota bacterium]
MRNSGDRGFTLLEMILVVLILSMVMAVAYPALSRSSTSLNLRTTGRDVLTAIRFAREQAVTQQTGMRLLIDRENQELLLTDSLGDGLRRYVLPADVKIIRFAIYGTELFDEVLTMRFLPNGSADSVEVLLRSGSGTQLRIISDPLTGTGGIRTDPGEIFR